MVNTLIYDIFVIVFCIGYLFLVIFLIYRWKKAENVSRPLILSLILYFAFLLTNTILAFIYYRNTLFGTNPTTDVLGVYRLCYYISTILTLLGPIYLIFLLEGTLTQKIIIKDKHIITISQLIFLSLYVITMFLFGVEYMLVFLLYLIVLDIQVAFFIIGFLYLAVKSPGDLRKYSFIVAIGYISLFIINSFTVVLLLGKYRYLLLNPDLYFLAWGILYALKFIAVIFMIYGVVKLYGQGD